jgi:hypothetical protein
MYAMTTMAWGLDAGIEQLLLPTYKVNNEVTNQTEVSCTDEISLKWLAVRRFSFWKRRSLVQDHLPQKE